MKKVSTARNSTQADGTDSKKTEEVIPSLTRQETSRSTNGAARLLPAAPFVLTPIFPLAFPAVISPVAALPAAEHRAVYGAELWVVERSFTTVLVARKDP
jgi:hypothetical protein